MFPILEILFNVSCLVKIKTLTDVDIVLISKEQFRNGLRIFGMGYFLGKNIYLFLFLDLACCVTDCLKFDYILL